MRYDYYLVIDLEAIACRMKLSILDMPPSTIDSKFNLYREALEGGTRFGVGAAYETPKGYPVLDEDWSPFRGS